MKTFQYQVWVTAERSWSILQYITLHYTKAVITDRYLGQTNSQLEGVVHDVDVSAELISSISCWTWLGVWAYIDQPRPWKVDVILSPQRTRTADRCTIESGSLYE